MFDFFVSSLKIDYAVLKSVFTTTIYRAVDIVYAVIDL